MSRETLDPETKLLNARRRHSELQQQIGDLQDRHDRALAESLEKVQKSATGEFEYSAEAMADDRAQRESLQRDISELQAQADAVEGVIPDLEREVFHEKALQARQKQSDTATQFNETAKRFHEELQVVAATWTVLSNLCRENTRRSDEAESFREKAGHDIVLPRATKYECLYDDLRTRALQVFS